MIGLYGGTFDPVHYGHLRTAVEVQTALRLDEIRFIPCRVPAHRTTPAASPEQRVRMLELALASAEPGLCIDARELHRPGPSYMVDTLMSLREELPETPLGLILGLDAFRTLPSWQRWQDLFALTHFIVMQRPGTEADFPAELTHVLKQRLSADPAVLRQTPAGRVMRLDVIQLDNSSTRIRQILAAGHSARYLTPDAVLDYMHGQGLY